MTIFILASILLVAALAIAMLVGVSPANQKVKVRAMYAGAALMLVVALIVCDYVDALPDFPSKFRFHAVLVSILMERQSEQQQALQKGELEWFAGKIKMFSEEEQKAILASAYAFAEHDLILQPSITIQPNEMCSQQELMYYVYSAFSNMGKKRSDIVSFLCQVFKAYFPAGESSVSKKMPGLDKVKERREKENKSK